ncbi:hypothetical protein BGW36DRAFT_361881 [Talaromyces proteolyticus]|uniref:Uncharacterized protein n=1 Tax=Talaromyces proteolyticus TaxID=1131652 RepID=A0AAD4PW03_9EURO|nr:uncharacterized protein BGW36DRAFT_361881 [Talaromyces proteolyticus]KAH8694057.1 hypothetical protein BGW36DRAFT_361881 [Talaromyces proteolyticus]
MNSNELFALSPNSCTGDYPFYICSQGGFSGCCSINPCDSGICPPENQPSDAPQLTSIALTSPILPITKARDENITITEPLLTPSTTNLVFLTLETISTANTNPHVAIQTGVSENPPTPNPTTVNGAIIGGVVGGVLSVILLFTAIVSRIRKNTKSKSNCDNEKHAGGGNSSGGCEYCGYSDSIFDQYMSKSSGSFGKSSDYRKFAKWTKQAMPSLLGDRKTSQEGSAVKSDKRSGNPNTLSPLAPDVVNSCATHLRRSYSSALASAGSSEIISIAGGVAIPASARSVSMGSYTTGLVVSRNRKPSIEAHDNSQGSQTPGRP